MIYGYARVSAKDQCEERQLIAMKELVAVKDNIYIDKESGKDFNRKSYQRLMKKLKKGDVLIVKSIDRLGRNYKEIIDEWRRITQSKGADIIVLDMPLLDTTKNKDLFGTFISDLVLQILSFVAENERVNIRQRQAEGIKAAKERGVKFGRPKKYFEKDYTDILNRVDKGEISRSEAIRLIKTSGSTYDRLRKEFKDKKSS